MSRTTAPRLAAAFLVAIGLWHVGEGAWLHVKARLAQVLLQRAWSRTLAGESRVRPWPWADTWPVARLRAPAHDIDLIVLSGVSGRTLAFAPGHAPDTSVPGTDGTAIIAAHRDTHFRFLQHVREGDELIVEVPGRPPTTYRVGERRIADARTTSIPITTTRLVLVTCYPFDAVTPRGPLRYLVAADPLGG